MLKGATELPLTIRGYPETVKFVRDQGVGKIVPEAYD